MCRCLKIGGSKSHGFSNEKYKRFPYKHFWRSIFWDLLMDKLLHQAKWLNQSTYYEWDISCSLLSQLNLWIAGFLLAVCGNRAPSRWPGLWAAPFGCGTMHGHMAFRCVCDGVGWLGLPKSDSNSMGIHGIYIPSKIEWDLTNGPLRKLLELLDTQV